ncbi:Sodium/hydrogen exchanger family-domain-containing protein [Scleroderma citrinum]
MPFHPFSLTIPHIIYACLGGFVVVFGMFSLFIREKLYIGEACWAFLFGVIIGPYGAGVIDPRGWANHDEDVTNTITLEFTRVVLAIGVFAIGVELPKAYIARHWKSLFFLLVPVMTWGWFVSAGLIYAFIPGITFLSSLAVAACLTPTDPILAAAVVGGKYADKHVPTHIRHLLAAESGCNDGAAYPFLFISLYLILDSSTGNALRDWFLLLWLYQVALSVTFGSVLGYAFRHLMKFCERKDLIDRQSYVAQYVSLAFLTIGIMTMLGSDDLLAAFCCGTAFAWDGFFNRQTAESVFSSVIDLLFNVAAFVYVGAWMPFDSFNNAILTLSVWRLTVIAILVLLLKRLPIMILLFKFIPDVKTLREAIFSGHFGPIGIGAVYISTLAVEYLPKPANPPANQTEFLASTIQPIVAFMVLCSITIHGLSIPSFSLGRRVHSVGSRTWSRHAPPEWATQTRLISRGEEVVINRDPVSMLEKGEGGVAFDNSMSESKRTSLATANAPPLEKSEQDVVEEGRLSPTVTLAGEEAAKGYPVDDTDTVMEWREGPHKIIERRGGPGQEVEVEVIRNAYDTEQETISSFFKGHDGTAMQLARTYLHRLRHTPEHIQRGLKEAGEVVEHGIHEVEKQVSHAISPSSGENSDTEGYGSGNHHSDANSVPPVSQAENRKKRPPSTGGKPISEHADARQSRKSRRRASIGEGDSVPGYGKQHIDQPSIPISPTSREAEEDATGDNNRGRSAHPNRQNTNQSAHRSLKHRRLESLKMEQGSREVSPSRSVRFADTEGKSGTTTPRSATLQNDQWFQANQVNDSPLEDEESTKGRVTFDLPSSTR